MAMNFGGMGATFGRGGAGHLGKAQGGGGTAPNAPVLAWVSAGTDTTPDFTITIDDTVGTGDTLTVQSQTAGGSWTSPTTTTHTITSGEDIANLVNLSLSALADGNYDVRCKVTHNSLDSAFSNTVTINIAAVWTPSLLSPSWWLEVGKGGLFQSNAGTTSAVANADVVGFAPDQSANAFTLTGVADDTTRPTLQGVGSFPYLSFDGSNDMLRRLAALDGWNAGSTTWCFTVRSNSNLANTYVAGNGNSASSQTIHSLLKSDNTTATSSAAQFRDDAGATPTSGPNGQTPNNTLVFNGSDHVILITDSGSAIAVYVDGVLKTGIASYTHTNTLTLNRFAIGALLRNVTAGGGFWAGRIYGGVIVNGHVVSSTERANLTTYMGALAGLTL